MRFLYNFLAALYGYTLDAPRCHNFAIEMEKSGDDFERLNDLYNLNGVVDTLLTMNWLADYVDEKSQD